MTPVEAYMIVGTMYLVLGLMVYSVLKWMRRNDTLLEITEVDGTVRRFRARRVEKIEYKLPSGVIVKRLPGRGLFGRNRELEELLGKVEEVKTVQYVAMWDIWGRKPVKVDYSELNILPLEAAPLVGPKRMLMVNATDDGYDAYMPSGNIPRGSVVSLNLVAWIAEHRKELYEETKRELSKAELIAQIALPLGVVILAVMCLILFPKIYGTIMEGGNEAAKSAGSKLVEAIKGRLPGG